MAKGTIFDFVIRLFLQFEEMRGPILTLSNRGGMCLAEMFPKMGELRHWHVFGCGKVLFYGEFHRQLLGILSF